MSIHEECGIFGIFDNGDSLDVSKLTYYALCTLQHRGQESCGITVNKKNNDGTIVVVQHKNLGLVQEVFNKNILENLKHGYIAVGHVRYSTTGSSKQINSQPLVSKYKKGTFSMAHNGNLTNSEKMRKILENDGAIFQTESDSEVISQLIARERIKSGSTPKAILNVMNIIKGAYSLIVSTPNSVIAVRDPKGFRPLCIGKIKNSYVFASETCAFDSIDAKYLRDVEPGEIVIASYNGLESIKDMCGQKSSFCIFEYIYFSRPDSLINGNSVHKVRMNIGRILAKENSIDADIVIGVPDSGIDAAIGYSLESKIPYNIGFVKSKYVGRTFIRPTQNERKLSIKIKLNVIKSEVEGKRVIMVDDSIVRGTTCKRIVKLLRDANAKAVHIKISSPPFLNPCYFGTDIPSRKNLIAYNMTESEVCEFLGADSLSYISIEGLQKIISNSKENSFCNACFTGKYPVY
ncbi:MAG: amidophosphoribosyltransferase [Clostridiales bacterium]|jgi:amidophosphoribosyltransferase|nr:amidophosphoribosyltransferase [Clostridiales bacterium]